MGYLDGLSAASFKTDKHGNTVFYPKGAWGGGRVLPDAAKAAQLRKLLLCYKLAPLAIGMGAAPLYCRVGVLPSFVILFIAYQLWALIGWYGNRRLLAGLPLSDERLKHPEGLKSTAASASRLTWSLQLLGSSVFVAWGIWIAVRGHSADHVMGGVLTALVFGACAAFFGYMLKVKPD